MLVNKHVKGWMLMSSLSASGLHNINLINIVSKNEKLFNHIDLLASFLSFTQSELIERVSPEGSKLGIQFFTTLS